MKILITGSTGFLGSYITKKLFLEGYKPIVLKRSSSKTWRIDEILKYLPVYNIDKCSLKQPFIDFGNIDIIIHTATNYGRNGEDIETIYDSNTFFPLKLLEISSQYSTKYFINTDTALNSDINAYALSKKQFLEWGKFFSRQKFNFINLKIEHVYGPGDDDSKFITGLIKKCIQNVDQIDLTLGNQKRDFIFIDDVVSAYFVILKSGLKEDGEYFKEYNVGSGKPVLIRDLVELIHKLTNSKSQLRFGTIPYRPNEIMESKAEIENLQKLGWKINTDLITGLKKIISEDIF